MSVERLFITTGFSTARRRSEAFIFPQAGHISTLEKPRFGERKTHTGHWKENTDKNKNTAEWEELAEGSEGAAFTWSGSVSTAVRAESEGEGGTRAPRRLSRPQVRVRPDGAAQSLRASWEQRAERPPAFLYLRPTKLRSCTHEIRLAFKNVAAVPAGRSAQTPSYRTEVAQSCVFIGPVTRMGCALLSGKCS